MITDQQQGEQLMAEAALLRALSVPHLGSRYQLLLEVWHKIQAFHTPLVVGNRVYFLYWGAARSVAVIGDWTGWQVPETLHRLTGTNCFVLMKTFPETACVQYKLIVDGEWILDPQNPQFSLEGFGVNSEFAMPRFDLPDIVPVQAVPQEIPEEIVKLELQSTALQEQRRVFLYPLYRKRRRFVHVFLFHDGEESLTLGGYHHILAHLFQKRELPPSLAIFLPPKRRNAEYEANFAFLRFCAEEVLPAVWQWCEEQGFTVAQSAVCSVGASLAGLVSTLLVLHYPQHFRGFIAQSPAYWWYARQLWNDPALANLRGAVGVLQTGTLADARVQTQLFFARFRQYSATIAYQETHQGHTWGQWRRMLAPGIRRWLQLWKERDRRDSNP